MQKGILVMLIIIAFLMGANLFKGNDAQAAKKYQYQVFPFQSPNDIEKIINQEAAKGWEYVDGGHGQYYILFRK